MTRVALRAEVVTTQSSDPSSSLSISLRNHDESQTGLTLDGIAISAPGATTNLRGFSTDLFSGAGVSFAPSAGAPAGTVNFRTLQPTATNQVPGRRPAIAIYALPARGIVVVLPPELPAGGGSIAPSPSPGPGATNAPAARAR